MEPGMLSNSRNLAQWRAEWVGRVKTAQATQVWAEPGSEPKGHLMQSLTLCTISHNLGCGAGGEESEEQEDASQIRVFETWPQCAQHWAVT